MGEVWYYGVVWCSGSVLLSIGGEAQWW